ncbi:MAG: alpha/beta fold hydrolase [Deltaproteobacteria bacterium]|nr:alpha/beta fold hydrolase [Deltaproteobacteria bacterium]
MEQQVSFRNQIGEKLAGTLHIPEMAAGCGVVFGHCFTCTRHTGVLREICSGLTEENFMALRFDFSGNGQSEGRFADSTYSKQISEMNIAADFIADKGADWIGLSGHSLGASIALLTAGRTDRIKAACALSGRLSGLNADHFLSPTQRSELQDTGRVFFSSRGRSLELTNGFFADAGQYSLPEAVAALKTPFLVVHGDRDEIIPVKEAYHAKKLNPEKATLAVIPDADHMFSLPEHRREVAELVVKWFKEQAMTRE